MTLAACSSCWNHSSSLSSEVVNATRVRLCPTNVPLHLSFLAIRNNLVRSFPPSNNPIFINAKYYSAPLIFFIIFASLLLINHQITHLRFIIILSVCKMLYVSHLVLYVYSYMSNVVNLYVRFSCMCIYCLYLHRRLKCLNHSAIHLTLVCIYIFILCYTCICHMLSTCMFAYHVCVLYVFVLYLSCMYLSWRHGRTAPWPSCLSRLKNLIKKK